METPVYFALALISIGIISIASVYLRSLIQSTPKDYKRGVRDKNTY